MNSNLSIENAIELRRKLNDVLIQRWYHETFLHWQWWFLIIFLILPWIIWWKYVDKRRLESILVFGFIVIIFNACLDDLGSSLLWWFYPHKIIPTLHVLKTPSISIVPCVMMIVFQRNRTWGKFIKANFLLSLVIAFIGEPVFILTGIYKLLTWNLFYSFLHYNIAGIIARWMTIKINKINSNKNSIQKL